MNQYKFTEYNPAAKGRKSGVKVTVSSNRIVFWEGYMRKKLKNNIYAQVFYDKQKEVIAIKMGMRKLGFFIRQGRTISSTSFKAIPDGVYEFFETTNEGLDVFRLLK